MAQSASRATPLRSPHSHFLTPSPLPGTRTGRSRSRCSRPRPSNTTPAPHFTGVGVIPIIRCSLRAPFHPAGLSGPATFRLITRVRRRNADDTRIKNRLHKARFDYRHPVFYSRKPPAASNLMKKLQRTHQHLRLSSSMANNAIDIWPAASATKWLDEWPKRRRRYSPPPQVWVWRGYTEADNVVWPPLTSMLGIQSNAEMVCSTQGR